MTEVLIVGGGPVGLMTALGLARAFGEQRLEGGILERPTGG
jgi:2-polyprenyl-6-methoxyphenol hydroxylase-like FAD-dependent oxidoreductase